MRTAADSFERRLRISAILIIIGLVVELFTLFWAHPTAFLFFIFIGGLFLFAGVAYYLITLLLWLRPVGPKAD